jgi:hypothetical protein
MAALASSCLLQNVYMMHVLRASAVAACSLQAKLQKSLGRARNRWEGDTKMYSMKMRVSI